MSEDHCIVKEAARAGFVDALFYDESRPLHSDAFVKHILSLLTTISKSKQAGTELYDIVELGAGTGIFTRAILKHLPQGFKYLATEPSKTFLELLKQKSPEVETRLWSAANIRLPDESVKNVVCVDCIMWFADEASLKEIQRVLVPGGKLIIVLRCYKTNEAWVQEMDDILAQYYVHVAYGTAYVWKREIDKLGQFVFRNHYSVPSIAVMGTMDTIVNYFLSISAIACLSAEEKAKAQRKFEAVIKKYFSEDQRNTISMPLADELYCTEKR